MTYKCNLTCKHCDIWNNSYKKELSIPLIHSIINSPIIQESYKYYGDFFDIAISGGEPLLINNIEEIMMEIDKGLPWSIHSISTNGTLTTQLIRLLIFWKKQWKNFRKINISIDWNELNHDKQRWINGSFKKSIETIKKIKKIFPNQKIEIKLTITQYNYQDIYFLSVLANKLNVNFSFKPVENMNNYTNQQRTINKIFSERQIQKIEEQILNNPYIHIQKDHIDTNFFYTIPDYLRNGLGKNKKRCSVAKNSITIMPDGKIFSCILMNQIWDINSQTIDEIWKSKDIQQQRKEIENGNCPECMLMCWSFKSKNIYEKNHN